MEIFLPPGQPSLSIFHNFQHWPPNMQLDENGKLEVGSFRNKIEFQITSWNLGIKGNGLIFYCCNLQTHFGGEDRHGLEYYYGLISSFQVSQ